MIEYKRNEILEVFVLSKFLKVNVNEIELDRLSVEDRKYIEKEKDVLNSTDNLFTLVIILILSLTFISNMIPVSQYAYVMALGYGISIITIIYIRYARKNQKKKLQDLIKRTSLFDNKDKIKVVNYHEKMHSVAMYVLLISSTFSLINSVIDIVMK
ncbi:hypothetical protein EIM20_28615 [Pseudomonas aeruginosa]|nr:hypothetical protein EIM20_28615 [Pseudomonas aeruginosa]